MIIIASMANDQKNRHMTYREEKDSMGVVSVPKNAYYGSQTQRAVDNFSNSGLKLPALFIKQLALVKKMAAQVNAELGLIDNASADAITQAATHEEGRSTRNGFTAHCYSVVEIDGKLTLRCRCAPERRSICALRAMLESYRFHDWAN